MSLSIGTLAVLLASFAGCERENPYYRRPGRAEDAGEDAGPVQRDSDSFQLDSGRDNWVIDGGQSPNLSDSTISDAHDNHDANPLSHDAAHQGRDAGFNEHDVANPIADANPLGDGNQNEDASPVRQEDEGLGGGNNSDVGSPPEELFDGGRDILIVDAGQAGNQDAYVDIEVGRRDAGDNDSFCVLGETEIFYTGPQNTRGVGLCRDGEVTCADIGGRPMFVLTREEITPANELCDGLDNDCDRVDDNGFDVGEACSVGVGHCQTEGILVCDENREAVCNAEVRESIFVPTSIVEDLTLSPNHCPYLITDNTTVAEGVTLSVEAGVTIFFDGPYQIRVDGTLIADGAEDNRITFASNSENPQPGSWDKIRFTDSSIDWGGVAGSVIRYSNFLYSGSGGEPAHATITMESASPLIENNEASEFDTAFIWGHDSISLVRDNFVHNGTMTDFDRGAEVIAVDGGEVVGNLIQNNSATHTALLGISCRSGSILIEDNVLEDNSGWGIYTAPPCASIVRNNSLRNNGAGGILASGQATINGNVVINNTRGIYAISENGGISLTNNIVSGSWHGVTVQHSRNLGDSSPLSEFSGNVVSDNELGVFLFLNAPLVFTQNDIYDNTEYAVLLGGPLNFNPPYHNIDAQNNWWGTVDPEEIEAAIYDGHDEPDRGQVLYEPLLEAPVQ